jgi:Dehydrogenases with different specificities (related to short-chain alcohol dehydrogenases)
VDGLTRTFAKELGQRKIRVNSINPGPIETEGTHSTGFIDRFQTLIPSIPLGRIGQSAGYRTGRSLPRLI